jgi:predicted MFS family arabinose efflux permease
MDQQNYPPPTLAWLVWGLGAAFYFCGFYHRVAPAVMIDPLMTDFRITAAGLGNFTAFYFYSYFLTQVPTGILADHWGPRRLLAGASFVAAFGTFLFASSSSIILANLGRFLIGGAFGVGYIALLTIAARWFPHRFFATLSGIALFCGVSGAVSAGVPLRFLVELFGWRPVMFGAGAILLLIGFAIWRVVRDDPGQKGYRSFSLPMPETSISAKTLITDLAKVFRYKNIWCLTLVGCGLTGPVLAFAGLWGVPFFTTLRGISTAASSAITSTLLICYAVGAILTGIVSDRLGQRRIVMLIGSIVALLTWILMLFFTGIPLWLLIVDTILVGLASGCVTLGFAFIRESVPPLFAGTAAGIYNMGSILGAMILQPAIGWLLDLNWKGDVLGSVRVYDLAAYQSGFILLFAFNLLSVLSIGFTTETHCRQRVLGRKEQDG